MFDHAPPESMDGVIGAIQLDAMSGAWGAAGGPTLEALKKTTSFGVWTRRKIAHWFDELAV